MSFDVLEYPSMSLDAPVRVLRCTWMLLDASGYAWRIMKAPGEVSGCAGMLFDALGFALMPLEPLMLLEDGMSEILGL